MLKMKKLKFYLIFLVMLQMGGIYAQDTIKINEVNRRFEPAIFPQGIKNINIYSRHGCGRCGSVIEQLQSAEISFYEYDLAIDSIQIALDYKIYNTLPYKNLGYSIKFPVIELDTLLYFSIENHDDFVKSLIEYLRAKDE